MSNGLNNNKNSHDVGNSIREFLIGLSRRDKQLVAFGVDLIGFTLCACVAEWLLYGTSLFPYPVVSLECVAVALVAVLLAWSQGLFRAHDPRQTTSHECLNQHRTRPVLLTRQAKLHPIS